MNRRTVEESQPSKPTVEETVAALVESFQAFQTQYNEYKEDKESLAVTMNKLQNQVSAFSHNPTPNAPELRLAFFDGSNALDWLFQAEQYFSFYRVPNEQRLNMIAFYVKGDALSWYKWMYSNHQFTRALEIRFGPSSYENHHSALFKLRQNGSVADYQVAFEKLCSCVVGSSAEAILSCFISGLSLEIQQELALLRSPHSISDAIGLAKLIEAKINDNQPKPLNTIPIRRLTPTETQQRLANGLCFNCDEAFQPGHKCKTPPFFLLLTGENPEPNPDAAPLITSSIHSVEDKAHVNGGAIDIIDMDMITSGDTPYTSAKIFEDLNLSPELLKGLYIEMQFEKPSKIQEISLPMILTAPYKHLIAQAQNGSGKTTCFVLGMLSRVDPKLIAPQALCICPTRELAIQNMEVLLKMGKFTGITSELAIPADIGNYIPIQKRPPVTAQVIIGTPGTISKSMIAKKLGMSQMKILVFDEADHMLAESGFRDDSVKIMKTIVKCNSNCQVLLFSATFDDAVKAFVAKIVKEIFVGEYNQLFVKKEELSLESVKQYKVHCPDELSKIMVIKDRILELGEKVGQTIIFVRSRDSATMLDKSLVTLGYEVTTIQGALKQEDRDKIIKEFKEGFTQVLISTDLLARGFDQRQVNLVVNFDLPVRYDSRPTEPDYDVYLHRVGRAGRFGRKGAVFNLLCEVRDDMIMAKIEEYFNTHIAEVSPWNSDKEFEVALEKAGLL